jgi:hypothetical protein
MDILKMLPRRYYNIDGVEYLVTNIAANVNISTATKLQKSLFLDYQIRDEETPRDIAERLYDDHNLYWTILVINDMTNVVNDWPLSYTTLYERAQREYTDAELNAVVAYADPDGNQVDIGGIRFNQGYDDVTPTDAEIVNLFTLTPITQLELLEMQNEVKRKIKLVDPDLIEDFVSAFREALK